MRVRFTRPQGQAFAEECRPVQELPIAVIAAFTGAAAGCVGTWLAQRERDQHSARREGEEKLHQLELRIVKLEAETRAFALSRKLTPGGPLDA